MPVMSPDFMVLHMRVRIAQRIMRARQFMRPEGRLEIIQNDSDLEVAGERLVQLLAIAATSPQAFA